MKLFIQIFKDGNFGNCRFDVIIVPNNKISVLELKQILYSKYGIDKSNQRLTVKMCKRQFVIMSNEYPLNFFLLKKNQSYILNSFVNKQKLKNYPKK